MKARWFVVTNWNVDCNYQDLIDEGQIRYIAYGMETCPTSGREHHQAFVYFHNKKGTGKCSLGKIGKMFGPTQASVQAMQGSIKQNEAYCSKESSLTKVGDEPKQGARDDLNESKDAILEGKVTVDELCLENPGMFHQYGRTLERIEAIALRRRWRTEMTRGLWITGPSGSGKSHAAFKDFDPTTHYVKNLNEEWWDGYKGQETVIFNEFRAQITFSELLDLADKWPKTVKWRNREPVPFLAKRIIITSVMAPEDCYHGKTDDEPWEQFHRRFEIRELPKRDQKCPEGNIENLWAKKRKRG